MRQCKQVLPGSIASCRSDLGNLADSGTEACVTFFWSKFGNLTTGWRLRIGLGCLGRFCSMVTEPKCVTLWLRRPASRHRLQCRHTSQKRARLGELERASQNECNRSSRLKSPKELDEELTVGMWMCTSRKMEPWVAIDLVHLSKVKQFRALMTDYMYDSRTCASRHAISRIYCPRVNILLLWYEYNDQSKGDANLSGLIMALPHDDWVVQLIVPREWRAWKQEHETFRANLINQEQTLKQYNDRVIPGHRLTPLFLMRCLYDTAGEGSSHHRWRPQNFEREFSSHFIHDLDQEYMDRMFSSIQYNRCLCKNHKQEWRSSLMNQDWDNPTLLREPRIQEEMLSQMYP